LHLHDHAQYRSLAFAPAIQMSISSPWIGRLDHGKFNAAIFHEKILGSYVRQRTISAAMQSVRES
jgi:hypothetical protein